MPALQDEQDTVLGDPGDLEIHQQPVAKVDVPLEPKAAEQTVHPVVLETREKFVSGIRFGAVEHIQEQGLYGDAGVVEVGRVQAYSLDHS